MTPDLQFGKDGRLHHFLSIEGLKRETIIEILDTAESFISVGEREIKKVPLLRGKTVVNLFFESSTRTRTTFEIAAKRLSADVINLNPSVSSTRKGETVLDTIDNLVQPNHWRMTPEVDDSAYPGGIALVDGPTRTQLGREIRDGITRRFDPDLIGGVAVQVGDELIDGSLAYKLNQARRRLAG